MEYINTHVLLLPKNISTIHEEDTSRLTDPPRREKISSPCLLCFYRNKRHTRGYEREGSGKVEKNSYLVSSLLCALASAHSFSLLAALGSSCCGKLRLGLSVVHAYCLKPVKRPHMRVCTYYTYVFAHVECVQILCNLELTHCLKKEKQF